jgi:hypothetical protein
VIVHRWRDNSVCFDMVVKAFGFRANYATVKSNHLRLKSYMNGLA